MSELVDHGPPLDDAEPLLPHRDHKLTGFPVVIAGDLLPIELGEEGLEIDLSVEQAEELVQGLVGREVFGFVLDLLANAVLELLLGDDHDGRWLLKAKTPDLFGRADQPSSSSWTSAGRASMPGSSSQVGSGRVVVVVGASPLVVVLASGALDVADGAVVVVSAAVDVQAPRIRAHARIMARRRVTTVRLSAPNR